MYAQHQQV